MLRLVVSNQKGGVAKTTTALTFARFFADRGCRVLVIDTDPQGCVAMALGIRPKHHLADFLIGQHVFDICVSTVNERIDVVASNRDTVRAEGWLLTMPARETFFRQMFSAYDKAYDVVLIDCSPSINMMQTCALVYAQQLIIPVSMDLLSMQGAVACVETAKLMSGIYLNTTVRTVAFLPVMVDRRFQMTQHTMATLQSYSEATGIPILPGIRTDQTVNRAHRARKFLADHDPACKAYQDYLAAAQALAEILDDQLPESAVRGAASAEAAETVPAGA